MLQEISHLWGGGCRQNTCLYIHLGSLCFLEGTFSCTSKIGSRADHSLFATRSLIWFLLNGQLGMSFLDVILKGTWNAGGAFHTADLEDLACDPSCSDFLKVPEKCKSEC